MKTALITSTGSVAADIVLKSLKRMGFRVIGCNIYPREWIVESCEVDVFYQSPPVSETERYLTFVKELCIKEKVEFILPMIDYEIDALNKNRQWFENQKITLCMSPRKALNFIRDKKKLADFIDEKCPETLSIPTQIMSEISKLNLDFPIVCKPINGRSSQGLKYVYDQVEWNKIRAEVIEAIYFVQLFYAVS